MFPKITRFMCENVKVAMTHIAGAPSSYKPDALETFAMGIPHIFVCGHSHILQVKRDLKRNNMLFLNPGAAGQAAVFYEGDDVVGGGWILKSFQKGSIFENVQSFQL